VIPIVQLDEDVKEVILTKELDDVERLAAHGYGDRCYLSFTVFIQAIVDLHWE
jgi:hypothetical protein